MPQTGSIKFKVLIKILSFIPSFPHRKPAGEKGWLGEQRPECKRFSNVFQAEMTLFYMFIYIYISIEPTCVKTEASVNVILVKLFLFSIISDRR